MEYKRLFIFVEGADDERFFDKIIKPVLMEKYDSVEVRKYAQLKPEKIIAFVNVIRALKAHYILITDINNTPCVTQKKEKIEKKYKNVDNHRIVVVIKEIESWYVAGVSDADLSQNKVKKPKYFDDISKEQFNNLIPGRFDSRINFMVELLKKFSIKVAKRRNKSFKYFCEKYI